MYRKSQIVYDKNGNKYKMNVNQKAFCDYYLVSRNATASYRTAYGDDRGKQLQTSTCRTNGSLLLKNPEVQRYLADRIEEIENEQLMGVDEMMLELNRIALDSSTRTSDRMKALELIGKYHNAWKEEDDKKIDFNINLSGFIEDREKQLKDVTERYNLIGTVEDD